MTTSVAARRRQDRTEASQNTTPWTDRLYLFLLGTSVLGILSQITLGGVVRVTGSGDGCPDWPQCFGSWIPPADYHAILEWSHRTTGTFVGVLMFLALLRTVQRYRSHRPLLALAASGFVLVSIVGVIGGQVVLNDLDPAIRTLHLGLAEIVLLVMLGAFLIAAIKPSHRSFDAGAVPDARLVGKIAAWAGVLALVALLSGAYAVWRNAGGVCGSWPLCGGPIIPELTLTAIHMSHRVLAGVSVLLAVYAAYRAYRLKGSDSLLRLAAGGVALVVTAQLFIGAANPWSNFDTWAKASHLSLATLMFAATSAVAILVWLSVNRSNTEPRAGPVE